MVAPLIGLGLYGYAIAKRKEADDQKRAEAEQARKDRDELRQAGVDVEPVIKDAAGGMGPSAVMVGKQAYGTEGDAQVAADQQNTPQAKIQRQQGALIAHGRPDAALDLGKKSMEYSALSKKLSDEMKTEGISDFIDGNMVRAPRIEDVEAGKAGVFDFNPDDVKKFNAVGGKVTIGDGQKGRWTTFQHPNGRKVVDFEVIDADGKPVAPSARTLQLISSMKVAEREKLADQQFAEGKRLSISQQLADIQNEYKNGMLAVSQNRAETYKEGYGKSGKGGKGASTDKMSDVDKEEFDLHKAESQKINEAIMRSQAEGTWEPEKNPSQFALMMQREKALKNAQGILSRYRSSEGGSDQPKSDPLGIRSKVSGQGGSPMPESGSGAGSDRFRIINAELQKAMQAQAASAPGSEEWSRLAADVDSLKQEIGRLPKSERGQVASAPKPAQKAPEKQVAQQAPQPAQVQPPQQTSGPGILQRLGALLPDREASTNAAMERNAEVYIRSGAKAPLEALLKQHGSRLSEQTKARIRQALNKQS